MEQAQELELLKWVISVAAAEVSATDADGKAAVDRWMAKAAIRMMRASGSAPSIDTRLVN